MVFNSRLARVYFVIVYGILLPWFAICFIWGEVIKGEGISPLWLRLQMRDLLGLLWLPPLMGMSVDLLTARWADARYKSTIRKVGKVALFVAASVTVLEILKFYVFKAY